MSTPRALADAWRQARRVVVLTGAGLSTASGIPDFRSPGGRWERYQPVPLPEFLADEEARVRYWRYKGETWQLIRTAEPNAAHQALTDLAHAGRVELLVTQNVDGLWKPATISFGQALVEADLARSLRTAATADLFVAAGTSLVVGPVNQMFAIAARAG